MHATGTFDVDLSPEASDGTPEITQLGRMSIAKRYHGALDATGTGSMLSAVTATRGSAGYVAIERVTGSLAGRTGSFVIQHSGTMSDGSQSLTITVVPDSGTDQLVGIAGAMTIRIEDGQHYYDFDYTLPD